MRATMLAALAVFMLPVFASAQDTHGNPHHSPPGFTSLEATSAQPCEPRARLGNPSRTPFTNQPVQAPLPPAEANMSNNLAPDDGGCTTPTRKRR